jgi:hypothetical protein
MTTDTEAEQQINVKSTRSNKLKLLALFMQPSDGLKTTRRELHYVQSLHLVKDALLAERLALSNRKIRKEQRRRLVFDYCFLNLDLINRSHHGSRCSNKGKRRRR